jgi:hypothetical protein
MGDICGGIRRIIRYATGKCFDGAGGYHAADPVKICDFDGQGAPKLTKEHIAFNGEAPELDHESFYFEAKRSLPYPGGTLGWACCKTARKPYDVVVVACLTFLSRDYGFEVSSDGDVADWEAGVKLAEDALARDFANPLIIKELTQ